MHDDRRIRQGQQHAQGRQKLAEPCLGKLPFIIPETDLVLLADAAGAAAVGHAGLDALFASRYHFVSFKSHAALLWGII